MGALMDHYTWVRSSYIASSAFSKTGANPLERVKFLLQCQDELIKSGRLSHPYKGMRDCFRRVIAEEGAMSLFRGTVAGVVIYIPTQILNRAFKDFFRTMADAFYYNKADSYYKWLVGTTITGCATGISTLLFVYPMQYVHTRLSNDIMDRNGTRQFQGYFDVLWKTLASDGLFGLYNGYAATACGICAYRCFFFIFYDTVKSKMPASLQGSFLATFLLSIMTTNLAGLVSYPFDTVRRRMMMNSGEAVQYKSMVDAFRQIIQKEGVLSLYKGGLTNIFRAFASAGLLVLFDQAVAQ
ncbi:hypothetical protein BGZ81_003083 [Podila clonocystis]|nr:hypothetical protein BGZ81_003083 [Podila clonocystis]